MTLAGLELQPAGEGRYILEVPLIPPNGEITFDLDRLRRERGALHGELSVRSPADVLFAGNFNVSAIRDRKDLVSHLIARTGFGLDDIDWLGHVEFLCNRTLSAERTGKPAVSLRDLPRPVADEDVDLDGVRILLRHPMMLFGDGAVAKSLTALHWAARLTARGIRVLYADWEFSGEEHRDRLERMTGSDMPDVLYARCERPMVAEADRLRRIIREQRVDYLIADSVAFAADGPPEAAEVAGAYFRALRQLGVGSLNIAHTTKAEGGDQKPFGSTFWHNGARSTWFAKRSAAEQDDGLSIALFNRKANLGPIRPATGYRITFDADRISFDRQDVSDMGPDIAGQLPLSIRMAALLGRGALTAVEIAEELDAKVDSVMKTARRQDGKRFVRVPGTDGIYRIGLAARSA